MQIAPELSSFQRGFVNRLKGAVFRHRSMGNQFFFKFFKCFDFAKIWECAEFLQKGQNYSLTQQVKILKLAGSCEEIEEVLCSHKKIEEERSLK